MTYAGDRVLYDADTHIMELPDFLQKFADPEIRDQMPAVSYGRSIVTDEEVAVIMGNGYNSGSEDPVLLIQYLDGDKSIRKINAASTGADENR